uniref:Uncharacterized protein n=1 Tax=Anopheles coluzzii TaxID=1518534 RepID=A0A8W7PCB4_ANOCL
MGGCDAHPMFQQQGGKVPHLWCCWRCWGCSPTTFLVAESVCSAAHVVANDGTAAGGLGVGGDGDPNRSRCPASTGTGANAMAAAMMQQKRDGPDRDGVRGFLLDPPYAGGSLSSSPLL